MQHLDEIIAQASNELSVIEENNKENRIKSEDIVRKCGKIVQLIHSGKIDDAENQLNEINISETKSEIAEQEYVETLSLLYILKKKEIPHYVELNVSPSSFLLGLADVLGELRREIIEHMRKDKYEEANYLFDKMEFIYENLVYLRHSSSVLNNFRRKLDVSRSSVELCRRDLLMYKISKNL
jgi:translin